MRASLGDFSLAPACPIEKIPLEECLVYLTLGSENDEGVPKTNVKLETPASKAQYAIYQAIASQKEEVLIENPSITA